MAANKLYRSLLVSGIAATGILLANCQTVTKQADAKKVMIEKFNMAKLGITFQLAQQQYAVGDYDKCRKTLSDASLLNVPHAGIEMLSGKVDIETGSLESAAAHFKTAITLNPGDPDLYYLLGVVYQRWQNLATAQDYYQQAWERKPAETRYMLATVEMMITNGKLEESKKLLESKLELFEQSAAVRVALARIATLQRNLTLASKYYRDAYLLVSDDENVKRSYAEALFFAGKYADAMPLLDDLRSHIKPGTGDAAQATDADRTALTLMLAKTYLYLQRTRDARACFQDVAQSHPENLQAILGLGQVCAQTNELSAALAAGKQVLRGEPRNVQAMILVALVQQKQRKWSEALTTLESAAAITPQDSTVLCMEGVSVMRLGHRDDATGYFEKAVAANPDDSWAVDLLASVRPAAVPAAERTPAPALDKPQASIPVTTGVPAAESVTTAAPTGGLQAP